MVNAYACNRIQPNLDTLQLIAEILQVDLKYLITDKKDCLLYTSLPPQDDAQGHSVCLYEQHLLLPEN